MALVATTLIAGSAFAAQPSEMSSAAPAATQAAPAVKTNKIVAHTTKHVRKHVARRKAGNIHQARHLKSGKTHQASVAKSAKHS
ncbi:MAG TPA: hypothetical protein VGH13_06135 [Xanthobacteraceae bacterium]